MEGRAMPDLVVVVSQGVRRAIQQRCQPGLTITDDRYPLSPRIRALQAILDKLPAAGPPASTRKSTSPKINYNPLQL